MFYTIITVGLIFLSAFIFLPQFRYITDRYSLGINFFLTLIATLVGVLLAISITNFEEEQKEKQDVIKLITSSISSVETCHEYTEVLIDYFEKLPEDDSSKAEFYVKNPPPYPEYLDTFLMQNIVSKNLSGAVLSDLNELLINLKRSRNNNASLYLTTLGQAVELLALELSFQRGKINEKQLNMELDEIDKSLVSGNTYQVISAG